MTAFQASTLSIRLDSRRQAFEKRGTLHMSMSVKTRKRRIGIATAATVSAVAVFGAAGGTGMARGVMSVHQYGPGAGQYQYGHHKVTICHKGKRTIRISLRAWPAHQKHGDTMGPCANAAKHAKKAEHGKNEHGKKAEHGKAADQAQNAQGDSDGKGHGTGHDK
jgi:hypothetical protein